MSGHECHVCKALDNPDPADVVYDDGTWAAYLMAPVPGWITMAPKEHVEGVTELPPATAATLGQTARAIGVALKAETGADRIHMVYLGEGARHFHVGFFPRQAEDQSLFDNGRLLQTMESSSDQAEARRLGAAVREGVATRRS